MAIAFADVCILLRQFSNAKFNDQLSQVIERTYKI